ncbi:hypothetical protein Vi05172_g2357 [Venturia inaequalis]|nr:hypothetical protein Vi05172_g2357 [Venturia inaequalis]
MHHLHMHAISLHACTYNNASCAASSANPPEEFPTALHQDSRPPPRQSPACCATLVNFFTLISSLVSSIVDLTASSFANRIASSFVDRSRSFDTNFPPEAIRYTFHLLVAL